MNGSKKPGQVIAAQGDKVNYRCRLRGDVSFKDSFDPWMCARGAARERPQAWQHGHSHHRPHEWLDGLGT
jgi:hypothetical protein